MPKFALSEEYSDRVSGTRINCKEKMQRLTANHIFGSHLAGRWPKKESEKLGAIQQYLGLTDACAAVPADHVAGVAETLEAALGVDTLAVLADGALLTFVQVGAEGAVRWVRVAALTLTAEGAGHVHTAPVQADTGVLLALVRICEHIISHTTQQNVLVPGSCILI